jgi:hypothetical protein
METPYLVQNCEIKNGKLVYDYMGSTEYEIGRQAKSLNRIFKEGLYHRQTTVTVGEGTMIVYLICGKKFHADEYQLLLQRLADGELRLKEQITFEAAVRKEAKSRGFKVSNIGSDYCGSTTAWFDFENDVLWTLSEEETVKYFTKLKAIEQLWSKK